uniref:UBIQUITIN_CONJUGAT_2 domain-containing protein n=1 Tax=Steinernema glaseri TaxID=37863 RepID=A0A1I8AHK0_9BILA
MVPTIIQSSVGISRNEYLTQLEISRTVFLRMMNGLNSEHKTSPSLKDILLTEELRKEHVVACEYAMICRKPIDGIYIIPSSENSSAWNGIIFIRCGMFAGAMLRFTLTLQPDFPHTTSLPEVVFDLQVFHPYIFHDSRRVDFSRHFPDGWKQDCHHIYHVLNYLQRLFFSFDAEATSAANPEAAILYQTNKKQFKKMTIETIRKSRELVYELPPGMDKNVIVMTPWDQSTHEAYRRSLLKLATDPTSKSDKSKGFSWMNSKGEFMCDMYPSFATESTAVHEALESQVEEKIEQLDLAK